MSWNANGTKASGGYRTRGFCSRCGKHTNPYPLTSKLMKARERHEFQRLLFCKSCYFYIMRTATTRYGTPSFDDLIKRAKEVVVNG